MHEADLNLPGLPLAAWHGHVVPHLATQLLLSIRELCDARCDVAFTASMVTITHNNTIVLQGQHTPKSKLWELNICPPPTASANSALGTASAVNLIAFAHAALFSLALSTLKEALQWGHLPEFMGLTLASLQKHPPLLDATVKGHLDQTRMNQQSTKIPTPSAPPNDNTFPPALDKSEHTHYCYATMMEPTRQTHMDLTGQFIMPSSAGNNYILIVYNYDSNSILAVPLPNQLCRIHLGSLQDRPCPALCCRTLAQVTMLR